MEKKKRQIAKESRKAAAIASSSGAEGAENVAAEGGASIDELQV